MVIGLNQCLGTVPVFVMKLLVTVISSCVRASIVQAQDAGVDVRMVMVMCIFILCKFAAFEWSVWGV